MRSSIKVAVVTAATASVIGSTAGVASAVPSFTADLVGTPSTQVSFQCGLSVTNKGPAVARNVRVLQPPLTSYNLGDLQPGETKTSYYICFVGSPTTYQYAVSTTIDPNPSNNGGKVYPFS